MGKGGWEYNIFNRHINKAKKYFFDRSIWTKDNTWVNNMYNFFYLILKMYN